MNPKLTLRMDESLVEKGKVEVDRRGKSVSEMVGDFFDSLSAPDQPVAKKLPPLTASLVGVLKGHRMKTDSYKEHIREKYLSHCMKFSGLPAMRGWRLRRYSSGLATSSTSHSISRS